jgi:hypothetical protein
MDICKLNTIINSIIEYKTYSKSICKSIEFTTPTNLKKDHDNFQM